MFEKTSLLILLSCGIAVGQPFAAPQPAPPAKPHTFDVVSIRPSGPDKQWHFGVSPTGFSQHAMPLETTIILAYFPRNSFSPELLVGAPPWLSKDLYDIDAKVAPEDLENWKMQNLVHTQILQAMLQAALADRCKLVVHRIPTEIQGWALVIAKDGPKFKEAPPDEVLPTGVKLSDGGVMAFTGENRTKIEWTYHSAPMASLATQLTLSGHPVEDKTGLTGKYQFVLRRIDMTEEQNGMVSSEEHNPANVWDLAALGLKVVPLKMPAETIVIDHVERPSEN
jgi:uncharacterized protein (TIGR03435 family)